MFKDVRGDVSKLQEDINSRLNQLTEDLMTLQTRYDKLENDYDGLAKSVGENTHKVEAQEDALDTYHTKIKFWAGVITVTIIAVGGLYDTAKTAFFSGPSETDLRLIEVLEKIDRLESEGL